MAQLPGKGLAAISTPSTHPDLGFWNLGFSSEGNLGFLEKWLIPGLDQKKHKMENKKEPRRHMMEMVRTSQMPA